MVDSAVIYAKVREARERCDRVKAHARPSAAALAVDVDAMDLVAFNLMLAVQACIDIAAHISADEGWPAARTLRDGFVVLARHGVVSHEVASALGKAVGFRNVVAHGYGEINVESLFDASTTGTSDIERFLSGVLAWTDQRPPA